MAGDGRFDLGGTPTFLLALNLGAVAGSGITAWAATRVGPLPSAVGAATAAAVGLTFLVTYPSSVALVYGALLLAGVGTHGTQCLIISAVATHYPAQLRGTSLGFVLGARRIGAVAAPQLGGWLLAAGFGVGSNFLLFAGAAAASACLLLATHLATRPASTHAVVGELRPLTRPARRGDTHDHLADRLPGPDRRRGIARPAHPDGRFQASPRLREGRWCRSGREIGDLMPVHPQSKASPYVWRWDALLPLAEQAGRLVPVDVAASVARSRWPTPPWAVGRSPRRRCGPRSSTSMPGEDAPEHRHTQSRVPLRRRGRGPGLWWGRDPGRHVRRGDFLPQAGWNWHAHHNATDRPMAWIDGLDIPFQYGNETQFFEFGRYYQRRGKDHAGPLAIRAVVGAPGAGHPWASRPSAPAPRCSPTAGKHTDSGPGRPAGVFSPRASPGCSSPATRSL